MIQRIQSVYLLLVIVCLSIASFGTTLFSGKLSNGSIELSGTSLVTYGENKEVLTNVNLPIYLAFALVVAVSVLTIFAFKNLKKQIKFAVVNSILYFVAILAVLLVYFSNRGLMQSVEFGLGFYTLVIGVVFSNLAVRAIRKDQKLIDSVNRLR